MTWFQRWIGRVPAVLLVVALAFTVLGLAGWGLARQINLGGELPGYRENILQKIADMRGAGKGGSVEKLQETLKEIQTEMGAETPRGHLRQADGRRVRTRSPASRASPGSAR